MLHQFDRVALGCRPPLQLKSAARVIADLWGIQVRDTNVRSVPDTSFLSALIVSRAMILPPIAAWIASSVSPGD